MKTSLIILSLLFTNLFASTELSWVDEQVQAIKPARVGMSKYELSRIKNPFIFLKKNRGKDERKESQKNQIATKVKHQSTNVRAVTFSNTNSFNNNRGLTLEAILNKAVMINGIWYKLGAKVHGYIVSDISRNSVLLTKNKKSLLLTTKTHNTKIKFQNK